MFKRSSKGPPFHIQLLSDKSVVLVEVRGYESEIFLPVVQQGRIALANIIQNRQLGGRHCQLTEASSNGNATTSNSVGTTHGRTHGHGRIPMRGSGSFYRTHMTRQRQSRKLTTAAAGVASTTQYVLPLMSTALRFIMKLISNGNVVLVECNGYESEIFLPHICSHWVTMKRVTANELVQCSRLRLSKSFPSTMTITTAAAAQHINNSTTNSSNNNNNNSNSNSNNSSSNSNNNGHIIGATICSGLPFDNKIVVNPMQMYEGNAILNDSCPQLLQQQQQQQQQQLGMLDQAKATGGKYKKHRRLANKHLAQQGGAGGDQRLATGRNTRK